MLEVIQPISKRDQVVRAVKEAILSGSIPAGAAIVEARIARQVGAGIPLVREALIELEHNGFVQRTPYKGTTVTRLEPADIKQIFRLRVELEGLAIAWARENVTPEDIEDLRAVIKKMERAAAELDMDRFYESDLDFHRKIWLMSGNSYLVDALERVVVPLFAFFVMKTRREPESYSESAVMHGKIVEAMSQMEASEVSELMKNSLSGWKEDMLKLLFS
ncbi:MAG TPA: GntR family transcriptional regulator [Pyrinomonadaceae bacterium]|nr:GntR family transcriptional regulator [Pyrinomonadaceae bacterium]